MKKIFSKSNRYTVAKLFLAVATLLSAVSACKKTNNPSGFTPNKASEYSATVLDKWLTLQIRLMRNATGIANQAFSRHYAYTGVAAYEALKPGLNGSNNYVTNWNGLASLPQAGSINKYYLPANVNAALAAINKAMFPNASANDKSAIDSLEAALKQSYLTSVSATILQQSEQFGKSVAAAVFNWAEADGYKNAQAPYTVPTGEEKWRPFPATATPSTPYWGNNRTIVSGSISNSNVPGPPAFSKEPSSPFYQMVKQVYDASQNLTDDQKAMALYWKDVPGVTSPGHWVSIVQQVVNQKNAKLDKAVLAYALTGVALNDVLIRSFQIKYQVLTLRPVTYIREVMGHSNWTPFIGTPPHPEYLSNHSSLSVAAAVVLEEIFGKNQPFTDHTYDYMGMPARSYPSYMAIGLEAGISRLYGGIHYMPSINDGTELGKIVAAKVLNK